MRDRAPRTITAAAIATIAAAVVSFSAPARAANVLLWACHGPNGEALGEAPFTSTWHGDGRAEPYGSGCEGSGSGGLSATLSRPEPEGGSLALWQLAVPGGVELQSLRIARETSGFGGEPVAGDPQVYEAQTVSETASPVAVLESASLEDPGGDLGGELVAPSASGERLSMSVRCELPAGERCAAGPSGTVGVDVSSIALGVLDQSPPAGAVAGVANTVLPGETLNLLLDASDDGLGLASAEASLDGHTVAFARLGRGACPEHPSSSATINLPLGHSECPGRVSNVPLTVPVGAEGSPRLQVSVTDAGGTTTALVDQTIEVQKPPPEGSNTITIGVGNPGEGSSGASSSPAASEKAKGGVLSSSAKGEPCRSPLLSMRLTSKPLRYVTINKTRIPVLRAGRRYRYRGTLTCLPAGAKHRVSAPSGTVVHVYYKIGRHTVKAGRGTMTVHTGKLSALLGYKTSRTIIFRYTTKSGRTVQVKVATAIARARARQQERHR